MTEIWVAAGTYRPAGLGGDRGATFQLLNGVAVYGGFAGGEILLSQRDPQANETILSGDLNGNDTPVADPANLPSEPTRAENSFHVVTGSGTDSSAVLDGFAISAGKVDGSAPNNQGGGMINVNGNPTLVNCRFTRNSAALRGGGMYSLNGSYSLANCIFSENNATFGGGLSNNNIGNGAPTLIGVWFIENSAIGAGGMDNGFSDASLRNCTFLRNSAAQDAGGMSNVAAIFCPATPESG